MFKDVNYPEEKDKLRDLLKYSYSKDVLSINGLLDFHLDQQISLNTTIEATTSSKRYETQNKITEQIDWLIEQHNRNIERIKETIKVYSL